VAASTRHTTSEWICRKVARRTFSAPMARKNFPLFSRTRSRESQSANPRLSARAGFLARSSLVAPPSRVWDSSAALGTTLTPPGRVLNPCTSQSRRASEGASRTCKLRILCSGHGAEAVAARRGGAFFRFVAGVISLGEFRDCRGPFRLYNRGNQRARAMREGR